MNSAADTGDGVETSGRLPLLLERAVRPPAADTGTSEYRLGKSWCGELVDVGGSGLESSDQNT